MKITFYRRKKNPKIQSNFGAPAPQAAGGGGAGGSSSSASGGAGGSGIVIVRYLT